MKSIKPDELAATISKALVDYSEDVTNEIKKEADHSAKELANEIRNSAKKVLGGSGKYAKGWTSKKVFENAYDVRHVIHNKTDYQLTHLLEFGHQKWVWGKRTDGRVSPKPHIRANADKAIREFEKACERIIKR